MADIVLQTLYFILEYDIMATRPRATAPHFAAGDLSKLTNFAALTQEQLTVWSRDFWMAARNRSFINKFCGPGSNAMVQRVTDLTKSAKGARAVMTLLQDMVTDGVIGDNRLEQQEEALVSQDTVINIDQLRFANRQEGRMSDQASVVNFRSTSRDALSYAMSDRIDQLAFMTLAGYEYEYNSDGTASAARATGGASAWQDLSFNPTGSTGPTAGRAAHMGGTGATKEFASGAGTPTGSLTYASIIKMKAMAKDLYIRGLRDLNGEMEEYFQLFVSPQQMAALKLDGDFITNVRNAGSRGGNNPLFAGYDSVMVDGVAIHEFRHVPTSSGAGGFGDSNMVAGSSLALFCGAQSLGMADIGLPTVDEESFDYGNQHGIAISKIFGFLKPQFKGPADSYNTKEDFGCISVYCLDT
jgi:N4-gp56 family major capsid protein